MRFQLIGDVLQQAGEFDVILFENGATEAGKTLQPVGDGRAIVLDALLVRIGQRLDETEAQHVVRQASEILQRVHDRMDQVVVNLYLQQYVIKQKTWRAVRQFPDQSPHRLDVLLAHSLHNVLDLLLSIAPFAQQLRIQRISVVFPATVQTIPDLIRIDLHDVPDLFRYGAIAVHVRQGRQYRDVQKRQNVVVQDIVACNGNGRASTFHSVRLQSGFHYPYDFVHQNRVVAQRWA